MKMNKKGFTLIEMLVVIAIIAVLVAIIIPTVANATEKANAAANAANLRSLIAEASIDHLGGVADNTGLVTYAPAASADANPTFTPADTAPKSKKCAGCNADQGATITIGTDGTITAKYGSMGVAEFAKIAETGKAN